MTYRKTTLSLSAVLLHLCPFARAGNAWSLAMCFNECFACNGDTDLEEL